MFVIKHIIKTNVSDRICLKLAYNKIKYIMTKITLKADICNV